MPGAFPGAIPEEQDSQNDEFKDFIAPSTKEFTFTALPSHRGDKLYPSLDHMTSGKQSLQNECDNLGYSKKLSNNVLDELDKRAATKVRNTHNFKKSVLSPRSSRYNSSHRSKFQKMDSISSHYAAVRSKTSSLDLRREEVEMEKENVPSYGPNSKRSNVSILESATKRRRTGTGHQELLTPSMTLTKVQPLTGHPNSRIPRSPSKANLQDLSTRIAPGPTPSTTLKKAIPHSRAISQNISGLTAAKQLPRSSTLQNLSKPTASSLQRSASNKNINQTLRTQPSMGSISSASTQGSLPRMRSSMNLKHQSKPMWR